MQIQQNIPLKQFNTFRIRAMAREFSSLNSVDELHNLELQDKHLLILGGGSNILFTRDFDGLVLKNELKGIEVVGEDEDHIYVKAGAGENWHGFVLFCVDRGYAGVENLSFIPGNVGASPMQNIGAYGVEIKDVFHELEAYHIHDRKIVHFNNSDCAFGYRESVFKNIFKNQFIILNVTYRLNKKPVLHTEYGAIQQELEKRNPSYPTIKDISDAVIRIRSSKLPDPKLIGNAGSFFKNPVISAVDFARIKNEFPSVVAFPSGEKIKLAAGWLIEQCGWKGFRKGDAGCYPKQALVLVNYGSASGKEIYSLSEDILLSVKAKFGVTLEREVNIM